MERTYTNNNLAGILSVALGLEAVEGRASFSGTHRETLRTALEESQPETFVDLLRALRGLAASEPLVAAVEQLAAHHPERSLQEFAAGYGREG
jgi:hypothetical protein